MTDPPIRRLPRPAMLIGWTAGPSDASRARFLSSSRLRRVSASTSTCSAPRGQRSRDEARRTGDYVDADRVLDGLQRKLDAARARVAKKHG